MVMTGKSSHVGVGRTTWKGQGAQPNEDAIKPEARYCVISVIEVGQG
jgi:hypothetical protein